MLNVLAGNGGQCYQKEMKKRDHVLLTDEVTVMVTVTPLRNRAPCIRGTERTIKARMACADYGSSTKVKPYRLREWIDCSPASRLDAFLWPLDGVCGFC